MGLHRESVLGLKATSSKDRSSSSFHHDDALPFLSTLVSANRQWIS